MKLCMFFVFAICNVLTSQDMTHYEVVSPTKVYKEKTDNRAFDNLFSKAVFLRIYQANDTLWCVQYGDDTKPTIGFLNPIAANAKRIDKRDYKWKSDHYYFSKAKEEKDNVKRIMLDSAVLYLELFEKSIPKSKLIILHENFTENYGSNDVHFVLYNTFQKSIKYLYIDVKGYNRLNDSETPTKTLKLIGPIEPNKAINEIFERALYSTVLEYVKILQIKIIFLDNTTLTLSRTASLLPSKATKEYYLKLNEINNQF